MKKLILLFLITTVGCINKPQGLITNKGFTDTIYYIDSYKSPNLYITKEQYLLLKETNQNNDRINMSPSQLYFILDGDIKNKVVVDEWTWKNYKEGQKYKE